MMNVSTHSKLNNKLALNKETLRVLSGQELTDVNGGNSYSVGELLKEGVKFAPAVTVASPFTGAIVVGIATGIAVSAIAYTVLTK